MKDDNLIQKALECYRVKLLEQTKEVIKNTNGSSSRYIYNELTRLFGIIDEVEGKLNTEYPTWDDIPF